MERRVLQCVSSTLDGFEGKYADGGGGAIGEMSASSRHRVTFVPSLHPPHDLYIMISVYVYVVYVCVSV